MQELRSSCARGRERSRSAHVSWPGWRSRMARGGNAVEPSPEASVTTTQDRCWGRVGSLRDSRVGLLTARLVQRQTLSLCEREAGMVKIAQKVSGGASAVTRVPIPSSHFEASSLLPRSEASVVSKCYVSCLTVQRSPVDAHSTRLQALNHRTVAWFVSRTPAGGFRPRGHLNT